MVPKPPAAAIWSRLLEGVFLEADRGDNDVATPAAE